ncbi:MAG: DUF1926 domain-containing protein [Chitinispirillaceae bacterium]|nr:DUF1926 domain-containing protein [Chitinispirillaceae bacterium]
MKRDALALLLHPYKNGLVSPSFLRESINRFFTELFSILQQFPQLRFNLVIPGYILEAADPIYLAQLRDFGKRAIIELICTGYTEPFLSFSPPELTIKNIRHGLKVIEELTGMVPRGFLPPFSNWEPSFIAELRNAGMRYVLLSNELFTDEIRSACGYWVTEHAGSSIGLIGTNVLNPFQPQPDFIEYLRSIYAKNSTPDIEPFIILHYPLPLCSQKTDDARDFFRTTIEEIEKHLLSFQPACLGDILGNVNPVGMQYIPTSLQMGRRGMVDLHFLNYLFSFDQIGFLQRKLLDIFNRYQSLTNPRPPVELLRELYFLQDINRFLPGNESGFEVATDREATYSRLIAVDREISTREKNDGGRVSITDFLHNGGKTIILSNNAIKLFISHLTGGQIIGCDLRRPCVNLCSVYNRARRRQPDIIVSDASRTWFLDRILPEHLSENDHNALLTTDTADFHSGDFDYKIHATPSGTSVSLVRTGSFQRDDRHYPLRIDKVFGIEHEHPELLFVYQLSNPSLMTVGFTFATELNLYLPGSSTGQVSLKAEKNRYNSPGRQLLRLPDGTSWELQDAKSGITIMLQTQKPATLWCLPSSTTEPADGYRIILTWPIVLEASSQFKILGKIICKLPRRASGGTDAI